jgi:iron complex outermembrane receptor protein
MKQVIIFAMIIIAVSKSHAQNTLKGKVYDIQSGSALSGASLYFPELHTGGASSAGGFFQLKIARDGKYLLQISHVGYENYFLTINSPGDSSIAIGLQPSLIQIREVVVTGNQVVNPEKTSFNVLQLSAQQIRESGALSISDAVSRLPGASQLTTGVGISKPVIRGLYGNRIQVNVNGMRFDNQQWQDEHGLGLTDMGIDRIEIIKGPASVLYGSDAMGGVLNIIEEKPALVDSTIRDLNLRLFSNTFGITGNYGVRKTSGNKWKRFRVGFDNHADYSDGAGKRVLNSRFDSYNLKLSAGVQKEKRSRVNNLFASFSRFGFVFDSIARKEEDGRLSRSFDGPHHEVFLLQGTSENMFYKAGSKVKLNFGATSNLRMEDEGGGGISLSMLLNSINALVQVEKPLPGKSELIYGASILGQTNTNFGGRIIVPDALTAEGSLFSLYRYSGERWLVETGVRYDRKFIGTYATGSLNVVGNESPTQEIVPFNKSYNAINLSLGSAINLPADFSIKINGSTGYRPGNLAELSSNGLHEGSLRWEIGMSDAKIEQNFNAEATLHYEVTNFRSSLSVYQNRFWNYIYLAPTGKEYFGFQIYHFEQADATLKGGEFLLDWNPSSSKIQITSAFSFITAKRSDGEYLPFIPPNKINGGVRYFLDNVAALKNTVARIGLTHVFAQKHPAVFETSTPAYFLLDAGVSCERKQMKFSLTCNNLLNKTYYDHLSRFKYYGIYNMGRNVVLGVTISM